MNGNAQIEAVITNQGSVKKGDELPYVGNGYLSINIVPDVLFRSHLPPQLPLPLWERDRLLLATVRHESFWRAAVNIATAKFATMGWEIESDMPTLRKRFQQLILNAEGVKQIGWTRFCRAFVPSFLCTKGAVVEIARETHSMGSRIVGLHHLDPLRCLFTNDAEIPVLYQSLYDSKWHELKWWQVGIFSDMPDVMELSGGAGVCAAEGSYQQIRKLAAIEQYIVDKVTGRRPLALQIVSGMSDRQIRDAVDSGKADAERKGWVQFMGALVVTAPNPDVNLVTVPLAELPDGFDRKQEFDIALLSYADNVGLDPQDLQPLTGQALGTGAQSQVLDEKSKGRGLKLLAEDLGKWFNEFVLPESVQFSWYSKDLRDEGMQADNMVKRGTWLQGLIDKGIIDAGQATNILVDYGDLPADYLVTDITQTGDISDDEKPDLAEGNAPEGEAEETAAVEIVEQEKATRKPTKEQKKRAGTLIDEEMKRATRLYKETAA